MKDKYLISLISLNILKKATNVKFWKSHFNQYAQLSELMLKMCTIPFSNAQIERDFSVMNYAKNKRQYNMSNALLNALMVIWYANCKVF